MIHLYHLNSYGDVGDLFIGHFQFPRSVSLKDVEGFSEFFDHPIEKIALRKSVTSPEWAVFDDEDLVAEWTAFFKKLSLKPDARPTEFDSSSNGGGAPVAVVTSNGKDYSFTLYQLENECRLELNGKVFSADTPQTPFDSTYDQAIARHGVTTPWD